MPTIYLSHFLLQLIPESLLTILFGYGFARKKADKKLFLAGLKLAVIAYALGMLLPIRKETATILIFVAAGMLMIFYNKIDILKALISCFLLLALFIAAELFNVWVLISLLKVDESFLKSLFESYSFTLWLYGLPGLVAKSAVVAAFYVLRTRNSHKSRAA